MTSMRSSLTVAVLAPALLSLASRSAGADTLINFDDLSADTGVSTQYLSKGVSLNGTPGFLGTGPHISSGDVTAHSPPNVLINSPVDLEFSGGPLTVQFTTPQQTVSLWGGYVLFTGGPATLQGTLTAYDQSGTPIPGADGPVTVNGGMTTAHFSVSSSSVNIFSVTLNLGAFTYTVIDDLDFSGGAPITPPASGPPVVTISRPTSAQADVTNTGLTISGNVAGQELLPTVQLSLQAQFAAPGSTPITEVSSATLSPTGSYSAGTAFANLLIGTYTLTVTATNLAGQTGSASVTFTNLPAALTNVSGFQYSVGAGACQFAIFSNAAATPVQAYFPATGQVIALSLPVFQKWQSVNDYPILRNDGTLGCPLNAGIVLPAVAGITQNTYDIVPFQRGSIYTASVDATGQHLPSYYTPTVFADAIGTLSTYGDIGEPGQGFNDVGGLNEFGYPTSDPSLDYQADDPVYIFQRFARPWYWLFDEDNNKIPGAANTLELRGLQPTLYVERVGGSMVDYKAAMGKLPSADLESGLGNTPTIWENYGCTFNNTTQQYQCSVSHAHVEALTAVSKTPVYTTGSTIPGFNDYCAVSNTGTSTWDHIVDDFGLAFLTTGLETEWSAIPQTTDKPGPSADSPTSSDAVQIMTMGWIRESAHSSADLPATHNHIQGSAAGTQAKYTIIGCALGAFSCGLATFIGHEEGGMNNGLWSDWDLHIRPLALSIPDPNATWALTPAFGNLPPFWNLLASNGDPTLEGVTDAPAIGDMEIEWEAFWQNDMVNALGGAEPAVAGAMVTLAGRWIIDCGHPPQHSEIHPVNTVVSAVSNNFVGAPDSMSTIATVWINELYQGTPLKFHVWAPPRPTPTAQLVTEYTTYGGPAATAGCPNQGADAGAQIICSNPTYTVGFTPTSGIRPIRNQVPGEAGTASISTAVDGIAVQVQIPLLTSITVNDSGQVIFPTDDKTSALGPVGRLMAKWTVLWHE